MKLICIANGRDGLTKGKEYKILLDGGYWYSVVDDNDEVVKLMADNFKWVKRN